jgi:hypothetical protein
MLEFAVRSNAYLGVLKLNYAMGKARYLGLGRNRTRVELMCVAHNMKRGLSIRQGQYP